MKKALFFRDRVGGYAFLLTCLFALLHGAATSSLSGAFFAVITVVAASVAQAVLILHGGLLSIPIPLLLSAGVWYILHGSVQGLPVLAAFLLCGAVLALAIRFRMERMTCLIVLTAVLLLLICLTLFLYLYGAADGGDVFAYLRSMLDEFLTTLTEATRAAYESLQAQYEEMGVEFVMPTEAEIRTSLAQTLSVVPGVALAILFALALIMSYGMQFVSYLRGNRYAFAQNTWPYRIGPAGAGVYMILLLPALFWGDFSSPLYLSLLNLYVLMTPILAYGQLLLLPRLFRGYIRMIPGGVGLVFPILMLALLLLLAPSYFLTVFAVLYAFRTLKSCIPPPTSAEV